MNILSKTNNSPSKSISYYRLVILALIMGTLVFVYYSYDYNTFGLRQWLPWFEGLVIFEFSNHINGTLFFFPMIYSAFSFRWKVTVIVWLVSIIMLLPHLIRYTASTTAVLTNSFYLALPLMIITIFAIQISWRNRERKAVAEREVERQGYTSLILKTEEAERQKLARELHDDTLQTLMVMARNAKTLFTEYGANLPLSANRQLQEIGDFAVKLSDDMRKLSLDLRPSILDNLGLLPALRWLVTGLNEESAIKSEIVVQGEALEFSSEVQLNIFRFVQEALNNVRRHSQATEAFIIVEYEPEKTTIIVRDNGKGFRMPEQMGSFISLGKLGVIGMKERARYIGADFTIDSKPLKGTTVSLTLNNPP